MSNLIEVAVAVIKNQHGNLLITKRAQNVPHGGLWEFPGGKLEVNEAPYEALVREAREEIGVQVENAHYLKRIVHEYPNKKVVLHIFEITAYSGEISLCDGQQALHWINPEEYSNYQFPEANDKIIRLLRASSDTLSRDSV